MRRERQSRGALLRARPGGRRRHSPGRPDVRRRSGGQGRHGEGGAEQVGRGDQGGVGGGGARGWQEAARDQARQARRRLDHRHGAGSAAESQGRCGLAARGGHGGAQEAEASGECDTQVGEHQQGCYVRQLGEEGTHRHHARDARRRLMAASRLQAAQPQRVGQAAQRRRAAPANEGALAFPRDLPAIGLRGDADEQVRRELVLEL
mmetsp:Transcript_39179/g.103229  ORF Transcript_39179/g.103229 Transcript_39179/m.103229 type:complete len:206 (+) Transcript_39179:691-1308(+)